MEEESKGEETTKVGGKQFPGSAVRLDGKQITKKQKQMLEEMEVEVLKEQIKITQIRKKMK